jgi:hypothetical protein
MANHNLTRSLCDFKQSETPFQRNEIMSLCVKKKDFQEYSLTTIQSLESIL